MARVMSTNENQDGRDVRNLAISIVVGMIIIAGGEYLGVWRVISEHVSDLINHGPNWYWHVHMR